jgi:thiamine-monophosphate kinase
LKLKDLGEFGFIDRVAHYGRIRSEGVEKGIGDDCAVIDIPGDDFLLITTDLFIEKVHFLSNWAKPEVPGAKALTVNVSDIAACGGHPRDAFVSIAVPQDMDVEWLDALYRGMGRVAKEFEINILGGDTTSSKSGLIINIALTGLVGRSEVLLRNKAQRGDLIALTGITGESAAGRDILLSGLFDGPEDISHALIEAHLAPRAHVMEGRVLATSDGCRAAIDVSDGLSSDLKHICDQSGIGAVVYEAKLPVSEKLKACARIMKKDPLDWVLHGGEDYVLLAAVKPKKLEEISAEINLINGSLHVIGEFVEADGMILVDKNGSERPLEPKGWDHFKS